MPPSVLRQLIILLATGLVGRLAFVSRVAPLSPQRNSNGIRRWAVLALAELTILRSLLLAMRPGRQAPIRRAHKLVSGRLFAVSPSQPL